MDHVLTLEMLPYILGQFVIFKKWSTNHVLTFKGLCRFGQYVIAIVHAPCAHPSDVSFYILGQYLIVLDLLFLS